MWRTCMLPMPGKIRLSANSSWPQPWSLVALQFPCDLVAAKRSQIHPLQGCGQDLGPFWKLESFSQQRRDGELLEIRSLEVN